MDKGKNKSKDNLSLLVYLVLALGMGYFIIGLGKEFYVFGLLSILLSIFIIFLSNKKEKERIERINELSYMVHFFMAIDVTGDFFKAREIALKDIDSSQGARIEREGDFGELKEAYLAYQSGKGDKRLTGVIIKKAKEEEKEERQNERGSSLFPFLFFALGLEAMFFSIYLLLGKTSLVFQDAGFRWMFSAVFSMPLLEASLSLILGGRKNENR